ncbi:Spc98 family-domain-containing protein [Chaetomium strumarium]|uniref:Spindle pole body component n=1 Tax=Chaetomium strumarium TaxID=1170767 RepID=A0AAJ0GZT9_9PEZI|nr:Spc98 family-domain-containing protein [Chaetomium strumarium]
MAYLAQLGALVDELVAAVMPIPEAQHERRDACREYALRSLRHHTFTRTNQFEVQDRLNGLEERFCVVGRDALAEALRKRLDALEPHRNQTTPEVLHLLLELADQPVQKSKLSDLDALVQQPKEDGPPPLSWREIAREDGWKQERDIWRLVDYAPGSSDEEDEPDAQFEGSLESLTTAPSTDDGYWRTAQDLATKSQGDELLKQIEDAQSWRHASATDGEVLSKKIPISTPQLLREVLYMLAGLETSLFDSRCNPITKYQLDGVSWDSYKVLVTSFAECGRRLAPLRVFAKHKERSPLRQVFQDCVQKAMHSLDLELSSIQTRLVAPEEDVVVSLMEVQGELAPKLAPLYVLAEIVRQVLEERNTHAFRYLELLYDAVGLAQSQGDLATYQLLGTIFFDCFQVYLKPIRLWMEEGKLLPGDRTFFVSESPTKLPLPQIWKKQFNLLRTTEGNLHAPRFLRPAIHRIFTAGKSIVVLKHMRQHESTTSKYRASVEPKMDFATVCPADSEFAPFSELFSAAFHAWIESKHHTAATTLRELLFSSYGLSQGLNALLHIYLMSDGSRSDTFASSIFRHLDNFSSSWRDRFTLTEIAQEAFSGCTEAYRLSAQVDTRGPAHSALASRSSVRLGLPAIRLNYRLSWPVQIVIPEEAIQGYQTIFTFQLQARRAISVLQHPILGLQRSDAREASMASYFLLRAKLLWFSNTIATYLSTLVLAPNTARLRTELCEAADVDDMINAHAAFISRIINESCQGPKLQPIHAQSAEMARREEDDMEVSRLSVMSSPYKSPAKVQAWAKERKRVRDDDDDEEEPLSGKWVARMGKGVDSRKPYQSVMKELNGHFERHFRFVAGGLRGVARASREEAAAKWDLLAEMLEAGIKEHLYATPL